MTIIIALFHVSHSLTFIQHIQGNNGYRNITLSYIVLGQNTLV